MIQSNAGVYIWLACLLVLLPLKWLLSALFAGIFHEVCHVMVLLALGGKIEKICISISGCVIESTAPENWQSMCSILAGPVGSLLLILLSGRIPEVAVCGLLHGLYNLFPVLPLDGGRLLQLLLYRLCPERAEMILLWIGRIFCTAILISSVCVSEVLSLGIFPVVLSMIWILRYFPRKISCKQS